HYRLFPIGVAISDVSLRWAALPKFFCRCVDPRSSMTARAIPRQAATVILLRRAASNGFEVLLTRRRDNMPFLGGMYCYTDGRVSKEDYVPAMIERCVGMTPNQARKIIGAQFSPPAALGL